MQFSELKKMIETEYLGVADLKVYQDDTLYRFTSDAIMLAKFATVKMGDVVADFCAGSGIVGFYLYGMHEKLIKEVTFFEMQKPLYDLSIDSIALNELQEKFFAKNCKIQQIGSEYCGKFSLIVCNPPYMVADTGAHDKEEHIALCRREIALSLQELIEAIGKSLKFGGRTAIVHRADRLADVICEMRKNNIEPKRLQFIYAKGKSPYTFMIEGVKGGKSGLSVMSPIENPS